ncbi:crotonase/enoyl-CoA hydratase family protein [Sagittula salina]|uniref:Crotonase/enoyl-CoA hydratase family protein n=1 Tax=Sagittula salina TaxID=2820268 RepID=A0A940RZF7_9RHOB|nr:crotonase/enoyl-CoA hydratase family protein [Sagittula salina]MBP0481938.1 crotonase/enoyl-CoA hydratase family protein [Sagittula salina]
MQEVRLEQDAGGVARIVLARAEKHNAMSARMMGELVEAAETVAEDESIRVVVLAADGGTFCAGGDLAWMREQFEADRTTRVRESSRIARALGALYALPQPLIGMVHGNAFGGGLGLISVCDVAVGVRTARFALTEVKLGLIPANIGPYVVHRLGGARAASIFMNGRVFTGDEAMALGLLTRAVEAEALEEAVEAEVAPYLQCAPGAVRDAKRLLRDLAGEVSGEDVDMAIDALADRWETAEAREGIAAFFEKRRAPWVES